MAYQTRGRDPLLDRTTQAVIEKRSKELLGIGLIVVGVLAAMMIGSYSPDDPNWMLASDAPVQNWLGRFGASLAQPLFMIGGMAIWGIAVTFAAWGLRLALHRGQQRLVSRIVFAPIAIAVAAVYCATLTPPDGWPHSFGVGGLFGDTVLGVLLTVLPLGPVVAVKLLSLVSGVAMLAMAAFVLGCTRDELRRGWRLFVIGLIMGYDIMVRLLGRGARVSLGAAGALQGKVQSRLDALAARATGAQPATSGDPVVFARAGTGPAAADEPGGDAGQPGSPVRQRETPRMPVVARPSPAAAARPAAAPSGPAAPVMPPVAEPPLTAGHRPAGPAPATPAATLSAPPRAAPPQGAERGGLLARMPSFLRRNARTRRACPNRNWSRGAAPNARPARSTTTVSEAASATRSAPARGPPRRPARRRPNRS